MRKMLVAMAAVASLGGAPAFAADMPLKAPPLAPTICNWCGWYVGVNGGVGWEHTTWTFPTANFYDTAAGQGFGTTPNGGLVGGQIGYNWQLGGGWILGGEFMGDWANLTETRVGAVTPVFPLDSYTTQLRDLETLTLRLGYAPGNWLFYGKGGVATGTERLSVISGAPVAGVAFSNDSRRWGPTAGVGVEYMVMPRLSIGVEYDYAALSKQSISTTAVCDGAATCTGVVTPVSINSSTFGVSTVVGRISYKFNLGGPAY